MTTLPALSVIIPALNAQNVLPTTLSAVREIAGDILVVDGGSVDETKLVSFTGGARTIDADKGRGKQLKAGGQAATGDWLLFLHADTRLSEGWEAEAFAFMADPANRDRAAVFTYRLDDPSPQARRVERLVAWRGRALGLPYGDQGLLIARAFYESLGGFRPMPLMEDVDMVRRIGRKRLVILGARAVTSAERYRRGGWWARPARNLLCLSLYFLGAPPRLLERLYR